MICGVRAAATRSACGVTPAAALAFCSSPAISPAASAAPDGARSRSNRHEETWDAAATSFPARHETSTASLLRSTAGGIFARDPGTLPARVLDAPAGIPWRISTIVAARLDVRHRGHDEPGSDSLDDEAGIPDVSAEGSV